MGASHASAGTSQNARLTPAPCLRPQDEPGFQLFPMLKSFVHNVSVQRPGALSYINLFPNYCYWFHPPYCNGTQPDCDCCYETYVDQVHTATGGRSWLHGKGVGT